MALSQVEIELNEKRLVIVNRIDELKAEAKALKKQMDAHALKRQTLHKFGWMSDEEKAILKEIVNG